MCALNELYDLLRHKGIDTVLAASYGDDVSYREVLEMVAKMVTQL